MFIMMWGLRWNKLCDWTTRTKEKRARLHDHQDEPDVTSTKARPLEHLTPRTLALWGKRHCHLISVEGITEADHGVVQRLV
jgi:phage terminase small subunit